MSMFSYGEFLSLKGARVRVRLSFSLRSPNIALSLPRPGHVVNFLALCIIRIERPGL
jgi:hypothetical protein